jgi:RND family efflux transporter MFP subunit
LHITKRNILRLILAQTCLAVAGAITHPAHAADGAKAPAAARAALTVTTVRPQSTTLAVKLSASGNIAAWQETIIGAQVNGLRLTEVRVNVGDRVKRGQLLASFDAETVQSEVAQQRANVAEAQAALDEANADAARARAVEGTGALGAQQISQYLTAAKTAQARLAAARAGADSAQIRLKHARVLAPDAGVISARTATLGAVPQAGQELFRLIRNNRLEWRAELTAAELDKVAVGQTVTVFTPAGRTVAGRVRMLAPTVDPQTRLALVYVDLLDDKNEPRFTARAGMYAQGEFALGNSAALTVPAQAVVVRDGYSYVFEVKPDNRVVQHKVTVGRRTADRAEILSGVTAQTWIVAAGAGFLNDGDLVAVGSAQAAGAGKPAPAR